MVRRSTSLAIVERRENQKQAARAVARVESIALAQALQTAKDIATTQGLEVEVLESGRINTSRDGFTWLCGSRKRKAQLTEAQMAAGLEYRNHLDAVHGARVTANYGAGTAGFVDADTRARIRLDAIERLEVAEDLLKAAHPNVELVVRLIVKDAWTIAQLAAAQSKEDAVVLEILRMGLDKLAAHYGFRSAG